MEGDGSEETTSSVARHFHSIERREKKQIGIVKPLSTVENDTNQWNCSELEKLQRRFSELLDGKSSEDKVFPLDRIVLVERLQSLYSSMGSHLFVSPSLVRLFVLTDVQVCSLEQWTFLHRGYPICLHNTGLNPRRYSELRLIIVDSNTGFILWSDTISHRPHLSQPTPLCFAFRHSDNRSSILIRFDDTDLHFFARFYSLLKEHAFWKTSDLAQTKVSKRRIRKSDISPPCHFKHLNHLEHKSCL